MNARRTLVAALMLAAGALAVAPAFAAGKVTVRWIEPDRFADAGRGIDRDRTLASLEDYLASLGRKLPDGQTLALEVTDVQLAGELDPFNRFHNEVRVLRGQADWPVISLRYTLSDGTRTLSSGEARVADLNYLNGTLRSQREGSLAYEKRMLDRWVTELVAVNGSR